MPTRIGLLWGRIELPRHRALVWHIFENDPWRKATCPGCHQRFTEDPRFICNGSEIHMECEFAGLHQHASDDDSAFEPDEDELDLP